MAERPGSSPEGRRAGPISREHTDLVHETEEGVLWIYPQVRRRVWDLTFRLTTEAHLNFFETLHLAVDGQAEAFYFIPDVDESPMQEYLVRKEKDFMPAATDSPTVLAGIIIPVFDYHLVMREESAAALILA
jgi:hypothetical protein